MLMETKFLTGVWSAIEHAMPSLPTNLRSILQSFAPFLPKDWTHYQFHINYRGSLILIAVNEEHVSLTLVKGEALSVRIYDEELQLKDEIKVALKKTVSA